MSSIGVGARSVIAGATHGITAQAGALALGITDGDVSRLSPESLSLFKSLSLTHLTAVSGANCAILIGVLVAVAAQLGLSRAARISLCLIALLGYILLVGDQPSVLRAAVMAVVTLIAASRGAQGKTIHLLALAILILLVIEPGYANNLGFALSVFATAGVVLLAPRIAEVLHRIMPGWLALSLGVAISAQLCCLPLLIGLQSNPSTAAVLANLLAEPAVAPITILGLLGAALALMPWGWTVSISGVLFWLASIPAAYIVGLANWLYRSFPSQPLPNGWLGSGFAVALLVGVALLVSGFKRLIRAGALVLVLAGCLFILGSAAHLPTGTYPGRNWVMVACDVGQGDSTVLQASGQFAVIDVGKDPRDVDACLSRLGVNHIALLVLTHFDLDHVGGLAGALRNRTIDRALLTQFVDIRPGAAAVERELRRHGIRTNKVAQGETGSLGKPAVKGASRLDWLVLSPHPAGADATTSNEGSLAMFWHSDALNIFTMADLPAVGQERVMEERGMWWRSEYAAVPTILKLSHHGSADQDPDFLQWVHPVITTVSVGKGNPYGHPTQKALGWLKSDSLATLRTDQLGSIAISLTASGLTWAASGAR